MAVTGSIDFGEHPVEDKESKLRNVVINELEREIIIRPGRIVYKSQILRDTQSKPYSDNFIERIFDEINKANERSMQAAHEGKHYSVRIAYNVNEKSV